MNHSILAPKITTFAGVNRPDPIGVHEVRDLLHLADLLREPLARTDKNTAPLWLPGTIKPGGRRRNDDVEALHFFVADLDDWTDASVARLVRRLEMLAVGYLVHSTYSQSIAQQRGLHRLRLICALSTPVPRLAWPRVWGQTSALLGGGFDPSCKDAARAYWPVMHPPGAENHAWLRYVPGGSLP